MRRLLPALTCSFAVLRIASAATLEHAGYLLGPQDEPVTRAGQTMQFRIVDAPIGGATM